MVACLFDESERCMAMAFWVMMIVSILYEWNFSTLLRSLCFFSDQRLLRSAVADSLPRKCKCLVKLEFAEQLVIRTLWKFDDHSRSNIHILHFIRSYSIRMMAIYGVPKIQFGSWDFPFPRMKYRIQETRTCNRLRALLRPCQANPTRVVCGRTKYRAEG